MPPDQIQPEEAKQNHIVHAPDGVIFQISTGLNTFCIFKLLDADLEALFRERERRQRETQILMPFAPKQLM